MTGPVGVSGSTPLTQRLARAAADAVAMSQCARHEEREYHWSRKDGVAAAAAMLRDLAEGLTKSGQPSITVAGLLELAESVERGE